MTQAFIENLLRSKVGLDAPLLGAGTVTRAVQQRMADGGLTEVASYWNQLQTSTQELEELIDNIVVPETWFFRDREPFTLLSHYVRTEWLPAHRNQVLRVLSVPCATGEEPYSIAIALLESGLPSHNFHIDAVDISKKVLQGAQQALYSSHSFRSEQSTLQLTKGFGTETQSIQALRERYFEQTEAGYQLCAQVRTTVNLIQGNLIEPGFLIGKGLYDVIFCRNLLIYFDQVAKQQAIQILERTLKSKGLLFLGHAETGQLIPPEFKLVRHPHAFAYRRAELAPPVPSDDRNLPIQQFTAKPAVSEKASAKPPLRSTNRSHSSTAALQPLISTRQVTQIAEPNLLVIAKSLADQGQLQEAVQLGKTYLKQNPTSAEAYVLLGQVYQAMEQGEEAERSFQKAVYLEPEHEEALIHLALIKEYRGEFNAAAMIRKRINRLK